jgi:hypothetical protein
MNEWIPLLEVPNMDWRGQGAAWVRWFSTLSGAVVRHSVPLAVLNDGISPEGLTDAVRVELVLGASPDVRLRVTPQRPRGIAIEVAAPLGYDLGRVRAAATNAATVLGSPDDRFDWEAVLGVGSQLDRFAEPATVGPFAILPGYRLAKTDVGYPFVPIHVRGHFDGPSWIAVKPAARRQARLIAGLLTVAWGDQRFVGIRSEVSCATENDGGVEVVEVQPFTGLISISEIPEANYLTVPCWLAKAWELIENDRNVANAVLAYHEGMKLFVDEHPSFAFAAFSAVMEAIGAITVQLSGGRGAMKRFRAGINRVQLDENLVARLHDSYSVYRSNTVHAGMLHGGEGGGRSQTDLRNPFVSSDDDRFLVELGVLKHHCRDVLEAVLNGKNKESAIV